MAKKFREMPSGEYLRSVLSYDPETGIMKQIVDSPRRAAGTIVGSDIGGHLAVRFLGHLFMLHRLAWKMMTDEDPLDREVDHRDKDGLNNRWANLRLADLSQQQYNKGVRSDNTSGFRGVSLYRPGRWRAQIRVGSSPRTIGYFDTPEEASVAYEKAAEERDGEFYRSPESN